MRFVSSFPVALLLVVACGAPPAPPSAPAEPQPVRTVTVVTSTAERTLTAVGTLEPVARVSVASQAEGLVTEITVREGDPVRSGVLLVRLDDRELQAQLREAEAGAEEAEARWTRTQALRSEGFLSVAEEDTVRAAVRIADGSGRAAADAARLHPHRRPGRRDRHRPSGRGRRPRLTQDPAARARRRQGPAAADPGLGARGRPPRRRRPCPDHCRRPARARSRGPLDQDLPVGGPGVAPGYGRAHDRRTAAGGADRLPGQGSAGARDASRQPRASRRPDPARLGGRQLRLGCRRRRGPNAAGRARLAARRRCRGHRRARPRRRGHHRGPSGAEGRNADPAPPASAAGGGRMNGHDRRGLVHWSITRPVGTSIISIAICVVGVSMAGRLAVDLLPRIVYPQVRASVDQPGRRPRGDGADRRQGARVAAGDHRERGADRVRVERGAHRRRPPLQLRNRRRPGAARRLDQARPGPRSAPRGGGPARHLQVRPVPDPGAATSRCPRRRGTSRGSSAGARTSSLRSC